MGIYWPSESFLKVNYPGSKDWEWGRFGNFNNKESPMYHTMLQLQPEIFWQVFSVDPFWIFVKSLHLCQIYQALRFHWRGDDAISLFFRSSCREPCTVPLVRMFFLCFWFVTGPRRFQNIINNFISVFELIFLQNCELEFFHCQKW